MPDEILYRLPTVKSRTGLSRSTIYLKITCGEFLAPIRLGKRAVAWTKSSIDKWIEDRINDRKIELTEGRQKITPPLPRSKRLSARREQ